MSTIGLKLTQVLFPLLTAAALTAGMAGTAEAQTPVRTPIQPDGCDYANLGAGWFRVGCVVPHPTFQLYRNDSEGGVLYVWAASPNGPFWQRVSDFNAQVAANQSGAQANQAGTETSGKSTGYPIADAIGEAARQGDYETVSALQGIADTYIENMKIWAR